MHHSSFGNGSGQTSSAGSDGKSWMHHSSFAPPNNSPSTSQRMAQRWGNEKLLVQKPTSYHGPWQQFAPTPDMKDVFTGPYISLTQHGFVRTNEVQPIDERYFLQPSWGLRLG